MPAYYYEGAYANGEKVTGMVEASSPAEAVAQIRRSCDTVLSLKEVRRPVDKSGDVTVFQRVSAKSLALMCQQFSIILKSGLPLVQSVDLTAGQTQDKTLAKILRQVAEDVSNGWSLSYSFRQRGKKLPDTFVETIRSGEESGDLVSAFARMSDYYDRMAKTRSKTASALMYPAFVLVVAVIVVIIIMAYAVPTLTSAFEGFGIELPWPTRFLIGVSNFMQKNGLWLLLILAAIALAVFIYGRTEDGRLRFARLQLKLPVLGRVASMSGASQFSHTMSMMLAAGMPIIPSMDVAGRAISNYAMSRAVRDAIPGVESGRRLGECLAGSKHLPRMLVQMTAIGESSGSIESTLEILAEYYDNEVETATARALSMLEPLIILLLAGIVVVILLAVYLPIFSMYNAI